MIVLLGPEPLLILFMISLIRLCENRRLFPYVLHVLIFFFLWFVYLSYLCDELIRNEISFW